MDNSRALVLVLRLTAVAFIVVFTLLFLASVTQTDTRPLPPAALPPVSA